MTFPNPDDERLIPQRAVLERHGISDETLRRRRKSLGFPAPVTINKRNFWRLGEIRAWEQRVTAEGAPV